MSIVDEHGGLSGVLKGVGECHEVTCSVVWCEAEMLSRVDFNFSPGPKTRHIALLMLPLPLATQEPHESTSSTPSYVT